MTYRYLAVAAVFAMAALAVFAADRARTNRADRDDTRNESVAVAAESAGAADDASGRREAEGDTVDSPAAEEAAAPAVAATPITDENYAEHIKNLKKKLPDGGRGFTFLVEKPFVVVGDEARGAVERRAENTVRWAVTKLKQSYFDKDPDHIISVFLFKDRPSYLSHTKHLFNDTPGTPYGYYSSKHKALIMNISTGGGTLVHEIVHPYMAANFPECPAWFNEGMGSLYEQCGEKGGRIVGYTNWRLPGLQRAIAAKRLPTFKELCSTTDREFYRGARGSNYAQARYLCYYLQEQGKLIEFYDAFLANRKDDPTGYNTLVTTLGEKEEDMAAFQKRWEAYVMKLRR